MKYKDIPQFSHCPFCKNSLSRGSISANEAGHFSWRFNEPKIILKCKRHDNSCNNVFVHLFEPGKGNLVYSLIIPRDIFLAIQIYYNLPLITINRVEPKYNDNLKTIYPSIVRLDLIPNINFNNKDDIIKKIKTIITFS